MTDTPTPERGEFSDLLDTLCSTWHQKEETDYDHMRGSCSTLDAARADFAYREARRLVVKHVDALRAECARKDAEIAAIMERSQYNAWKVGVLTRTLGVASPIHSRMSFDDMAQRYNLAPFNPGAPRDGE